MVASRVRADHLIKGYKGSLDVLYKVLISNGRIDEWANISVVAQFLARLGRLLSANELPTSPTWAEFGPAVKYWADTVAVLYSGMTDERELRGAMDFLKKSFC